MQGMAGAFAELLEMTGATALLALPAGAGRG